MNWAIEPAWRPAGAGSRKRARLWDMAGRGATPPVLGSAALPPSGRARESGRMPSVSLVAGDALARYGFGDGHPFGPDRQEAFLREVRRSDCYRSLDILAPRSADRAEIE